MRIIFLLLFPLALTAAGRPAERPAVAKQGQLAPQVVLKKIINGDITTMKGWEELKGKAVVMEFWATFCDPCVENIPHLNELAAKFKDKPVIFLSVSKENEAAVRKFLKIHAMSGNVAAEAGAVFKSFNVFGTPRTVLIDKNSRVAAFSYPSSVTEATIENLLAGKELKSDEPQRRKVLRATAGPWSSLP